MQDIDELCARIEADVQELLLSGDPNADPPPGEAPDPGVGLPRVAIPRGPSVPTGRVMVGVHHRLLLHRMATA